MAYNVAQTKYLNKLIDNIYYQKRMEITKEFPVMDIPLTELPGLYEKGEYEVIWQYGKPVIVFGNYVEANKKRTEAFKKLDKERELLSAEILFVQDGIDLVKKIQEW